MSDDKFRSIFDPETFTQDTHVDKHSVDSQQASIYFGLLSGKLENQLHVDDEPHPFIVVRKERAKNSPGELVAVFNSDTKELFIAPDAKIKKTWETAQAVSGKMDELLQRPAEEMEEPVYRALSRFVQDSGKILGKGSMEIAITTKDGTPAKLLVPEPFKPDALGHIAVTLKQEGTVQMHYDASLQDEMHASLAKARTFWADAQAIHEGTRSGLTQVSLNEKQALEVEHPIRTAGGHKKYLWIEASPHEHSRVTDTFADSKTGHIVYYAVRNPNPDHASQISVDVAALRPVLKDLKNEILRDKLELDGRKAEPVTLTQEQWQDVQTQLKGKLDMLPVWENHEISSWGIGSKGKAIGKAERILSDEGGTAIKVSYFDPEHPKNDKAALLHETLQDALAEKFVKEEKTDSKPLKGETRTIRLTQEQWNELYEKADTQFSFANRKGATDAVDCDISRRGMAAKKIGSARQVNQDADTPVDVTYLTSQKTFSKILEKIVPSEFKSTSATKPKPGDEPKKSGSVDKGALLAGVLLAAGSAAVAGSSSGKSDEEQSFDDKKFSKVKKVHVGTVLGITGVGVGIGLAADAAFNQGHARKYLLEKLTSVFHGRA